MAFISLNDVINNHHSCRPSPPKPAPDPISREVDSLKQLKFELQRAAEKTQEAIALAAEESAKVKAAKEVIMSLTAQLKDMAERFPPGVYDSSNIRSINLPNGFEYPHADYSSNTAGNKSESLFGTENGFKFRNQGSTSSNQMEAEWIEKYEPGVYITLVALPDGIRDLKQVRFSRRRFNQHQADTWWSENREKVYQWFNVDPMRWAK